MQDWFHRWSYIASIHSLEYVVASIYKKQTSCDWQANQNRSKNQLPSAFASHEGISNNNRNWCITSTHAGAQYPRHAIQKQYMDFAIRCNKLLFTLGLLFCMSSTSFSEKTSQIPSFQHVIILHPSKLNHCTVWTWHTRLCAKEYSWMLSLNELRQLRQAGTHTVWISRVAVEHNEFSFIYLHDSRWLETTTKSLILVHEPKHDK